MDLTHFIDKLTIEQTRPRAPQFVIYCNPPNGRCVHCPDAETAKSAAAVKAAESPGMTFAVYELVGYAFQQITAPEFTEAASEKAREELRDTEPEAQPPSDDKPAEGWERPVRGDLSDEQRTTLEVLRAATKHEPV